MKAEILHRFSLFNDDRSSCSVLINCGTRNLKKKIINEEVKANDSEASDDLVDTMVITDPDLLLVGTVKGRIMIFPIPVSLITSDQEVLSHNFSSMRPKDLAKELHHYHTSQITCLLFVPKSNVTVKGVVGLLITGSFDRTIKVWLIYQIHYTNHSSPLLQTLYGHNSSVTHLIDTKNSENTLY